MTFCRAWWDLSQRFVAALVEQVVSAAIRPNRVMLGGHGEEVAEPGFEPHHRLGCGQFKPQQRFEREQMLERWDGEHLAQPCDEHVDAHHAAAVAAAVAVGWRRRFLRLRRSWHFRLAGCFMSVYPHAAARAMLLMSFEVE